MVESEQTIEHKVGYDWSPEEKEWVRKVREEGDRSSFKRIFHTYYRRLHGFAYSFVKQRQEAEDIVQSVFLNIWDQRENWNPPGSVKHYLFAAVRNEALNTLRHQRVVEKTEDEVSRLFRELKSRSVSEEGHELKELKKDIQHGIEQLPPRCRQIFILNRRSGLTYSEIAYFLDISVNTVGTQMGRALESLRKYLTNHLYLLTVTVELSAVLFHL